METTMSASTENLKLVLADTFVLYMKTYAVHWNYKGSKFFSVHKLTQEHYQELADAIDEIAERIRAKGDEAPISLSSILGSSDMGEMKSHSASDDNALYELIAGHRLLAQRAKEAAEKLEEEGDYYSNDMMVGRIGAHEKAAWMLKSFLSGQQMPQSGVEMTRAHSDERPSTGLNS
jgi:starvation-inducible DNA-binding protein